jgi:hypothetical protein
MKPYFSICIPQYNRTSFLMEAVRSYAAQSFRDFELCISDGGSNDGRIDELESFLEESGLRYRFSRSEFNKRYDENLRSAIALSSGRYLLLMGNDDAFADNDCLQDLHDTMERFPNAVVAITNYTELADGREFRRMTTTGVIGKGPHVAAATFRDYAFVSGILLDGPGSRAAASDLVDGSEMYQMYLGALLVAGGGEFLSIDRLLIHKDIQLEGESVDSYRTRKREPTWSFKERKLPLTRILQTVSVALEAGDPNGDHRSQNARLAKQLYTFTYPFWGIEYRRIQSFAYAVGLYWALRPSETARDVQMHGFDRAMVWALYILFGAASLIVPVPIFDLMRGKLYKFAKKRQEDL